MMFLEFFVWGAWLPLIFAYLPSLGFDAAQQAWVLNAFPIGALAALFFSTQFADRKFAAEKFLAASHLVGGLAILALAWTREFHPFFRLMLVHCLCYVPTISITNSIAFTHLPDARDFGRVRLWGTIGWIAAQWPFTLILVDWESVPSLASLGLFEWIGTALASPLEGDALLAGTRYTFLVAGLASLALAALSLALPHTPPRPAGGTAGALAWLDALKLLRVPFVLVLFVVTFLDAAVHQSYFFFANDYLKHVGVPGNWTMPVMSLGQVSEIATMAILAGVLKRLGWRTTMTLGVLGHALRFTVFAFVPAPVPAALVILVHGVCYAFFFATVYIFVDEFFPKEARSSAQGLFNVLILGLGPFVGNRVSASLAARFHGAEGIDFQRLFLVPAGTALYAALVLYLFFRPPARALGA
jgi:nucleoside transporter